jgi:pimeloyl-[acyl-carrier protein] synthase
MLDFASSFDPANPAFRADPYPFYHLLRSAAPVYWEGSLGSWILTRYADVVAVLRDPRFVVGFTAKALPMLLPRYEAMARMFQGWMLYQDPPEHTRLRTLVNKAFTPRVVEQLRPHMEQIVGDLLDQAQAHGSLELIADYAFPLPVTVIAQMLGVPAADRPLFKRWAQGLVGTLEPFIPAEVLDHANQVTVEVLDYFRRLAAEKRRSPGDDLLSALIAAEEQGRQLSNDDVLSTCVLLLFAGHETTVNLIGNGTLALLRHPEQLGQLRANPDLIKSAVEELLRFDSPVQLTGRVAMEDVVIDGQTIQAGQDVMMLLGAANRDPEQFTDPDRLDLGRSDNKHLAFGGGIHYCVGAPLARVEAQAALPALLQRLPELKLTTEQLEWKETLTLRGLKALPLSW